MLELGPESKVLHAACGERAAQAGIDIVIGVRGYAQNIADKARDRGAQSLFFETPEEAGKWLRQNLRPEDVVLLKASRGVRLERALEALTAEDSA
jgi:UDP-N-acetylmuramoyl-tripeptide--D-alanyl-D-alanine ligase